MKQVNSMVFSMSQMRQVGSQRSCESPSRHKELIGEISGKNESVFLDDYELSDLQNLKTLRRISMESLSPPNVRFELTCSLNDFNELMHEEDKYPNFGQNHRRVDPVNYTLSSPTLQFSLSKLTISNVSRERDQAERSIVQKPRQNRIKRTLYEGPLELTANRIITKQFYAKVKATSLHNKVILHIKAKGIRRQKFMITKQQYSRLKKRGFLDNEEVEVWLAAQYQWMQDCVLNLYLIDMIKKQ